MSVDSQNDLIVSSAVYTSTQQTTPDIPCRKLTLQVEGAAIYFQTLSQIHSAFAAGDQEIKMLPGFGSFTFTTPIYGFRWRKSAAAVSNPILSYIYDA